MRFNKAIILKVYIYTEEELEVRDLGMAEDDSAGFNKIENRAFWSIDFAYPFQAGDTRTCFVSGGESFVAPVSFESFVAIIDNYKKITNGD